MTHNELLINCSGIVKIDLSIYNDRNMLDKILETPLSIYFKCHLTVGESLYCIIEYHYLHCKCIYFVVVEGKGSVILWSVTTVVKLTLQKQNCEGMFWGIFSSIYGNVLVVRTSVFCSRIFQFMIITLRGDIEHLIS